MFECLFASRWSVVCILLLGSCASGCGGGASGYRVSGTVNFNGKPVPAGKIYFRPDGSKNNTGATGYADIKDGHYDTSLPGGQGAPSAAVIIMVEGTDPNAAPDAKSSPDVTVKLLFSGYEVPAELPEAASTKDIDVPAEAAKGPKQPKASNVVIP